MEILTSKILKVQLTSHNTYFKTKIFVHHKCLTTYNILWLVFIVNTAIFMIYRLLRNNYSKENSNINTHKPLSCFFPQCGTQYNLTIKYLQTKSLTIYVIV